MVENIFYLFYNFIKLITIFPNINFLFEYFFIQLSFLFLFIYILLAEKIFTALLGFVLLVFIVVGFLIILQFDALAIILLNTELVAILIFILCGWSFCYDNNLNFKNEQNTNKSAIFLIFLFNGFVFFIPGSLFENYFCPLIDGIEVFLENYYELNNNITKNSFNCYYFYYYVFNLLALIIIGILVTIVSFICIILNNFFWKKKITNFSYFSNYFNTFKSLFNLFFLKKQNLTNQNFQQSSIRFFKKKNTQGIYINKVLEEIKKKK